ncbi:MAG: hypothetical protein H0T47_15160 [Planctomycetaceae bacterium]|nr:hypothetical protein [Planctomycetaceae bacterium]
MKCTRIGRPASDETSAVRLPIDLLIYKVAADLFAVGDRETRNRVPLVVPQLDESCAHRAGVEIQPEAIAAEGHDWRREPAAMMIRVQ